MKRRSDPGFAARITSIAVTRSVIITAYHIVYPFLPAFARGMGVSLQTAGLAVSARSIVGMAAPLLGPVSDLRGRKFSLVASTFLFAAGMAIVAAFPSYATFVVALLIAHLARIVFDPALQAYVGDHVHYAQRGSVFALVELSWSGSFLLVIPLVGLLIAREGWSAPFGWLALVAVAAGSLLALWLPSSSAAQSGQPPFFQDLAAIFGHKQALAGLAYGACISLANDLVVIVYGAWLEAEFGLQVAALGLASTVVGLALLAGEILVWIFVDRVGKKRALVAGTLASAATSVALPVVGRSLAWSLVGLFLLYTSFEFMLVTSFPLMTELVPQARGTYMAGLVASFSAGRALGAWLGPTLFAFGMLANGFAALGVYLIGLVILSVFVRVE
jgi:predicted MFS family arabinose efflux permease